MTNISSTEAASVQSLWPLFFLKLKYTWEIEDWNQRPLKLGEMRKIAVPCASSVLSVQSISRSCAVKKFLPTLDSTSHSPQDHNNIINVNLNNTAC